jgi:hypothetical protein
MKRRSLLLFGALSPIALFTSRYLGARAPKAPLPTDYRQRVEELNQLASTIQTPRDARRFVDFLADLFAKDTPSTWTRSSQNPTFREYRLQVTISAFVVTCRAPMVLNQRTGFPHAWEPEAVQMRIQAYWSSDCDHCCCALLP